MHDVCGFPGRFGGKAMNEVTLIEAAEKLKNMCDGNTCNLCVFANKSQSCRIKGAPGNWKIDTLIEWLKEATNG